MAQNLTIGIDMSEWKVAVRELGEAAAALPDVPDHLWRRMCALLDGSGGEIAEETRDGQLFVVARPSGEMLAILATLRALARRPA